MKKPLIIVAVLVAIVVIVIFVLPFVIPVSVYKGRIIAAVEQATGRSFAINGPIRLSFLPHAEIDVSDVTLGNPAGMPGDLMKLGKLELRINPLALLSRRLEIDAFVLVDPQIALAVDKSGRANWRFAAKAPPPAAKATPPTAKGTQPPTAAIAPAPASNGSEPKLSGIHLNDVRLVNGTMSYSDARSGEHQQLEAINASLSLPDLASPMVATGDARWKGKTVKLSLDLAKPGAVLVGDPSPVTLKLAASPVSFGFKGSVDQEPQLRLAGTTTLDVPSIRELAAWTGTPLPSTRGGLGTLKISGNFDHQGARISFKNAEIVLDGMTGKGDFTVDTAAARPAVKGTLDIDRLNVTPYLPPEKPATKAGTKAGTKAPAPAPSAPPAAPSGGAPAPLPAATPQAGWSDTPIDVSALRVVDADFVLTAGGIEVGKIKIGASALTLHLKDGRLATDLTKMQLYQGAGKGSLKLDGSGAVPALDAAFTLDKVQAEPLLKDAMDFDRLTGTANADVALRSQGRSQRELIGNLAGKGALHFTDGAIKGIDIGALIHNVANALNDSGAQSRQRTEFSELSGNFTIAKGILENKDLELKSPLLRVTGAGTVDLPQRTVNYRIEPRLALTTQGQGGRADVAGITVPVVIEGPWSHLRYRPQIGDLLKQPDKALKQIEGALKGGAAPGAAQGGSAATPGASPKPSKPVDVLRSLLGGTKK